MGNVWLFFHLQMQPYWIIYSTSQKFHMTAYIYVRYEDLIILSASTSLLASTQDPGT